ncbi:MAG: peptide-methionine (S)-S-oxide reductase MsrA [Dehalococcoidia bacterium]|nr:peptide-methionine (S)-S-oxide reductase MsrA [Dehalococcoidia bacterium]
MSFDRVSLEIPSPQAALPGRSESTPVPETHLVFGTPLQGPWPDRTRLATFGMGCFWGTEKFMWQAPGVYSTFVGYAGGHTPNPTYDEVCSGRTGHNEVAVVVYDLDQGSYEDLLKVFWENHDPTQGMRQGNDIGTQYRSAIYTHDDEQREAALRSRERYQQALHAAGYGDITTEIVPAGAFYYAEPFHQQYLARNPMGYCNHGFCQVAYDPTQTLEPSIARAELPQG